MTTDNSLWVLTSGWAKCMQDCMVIEVMRSHWLVNSDYADYVLVEPNKPVRPNQAQIPLKV